MVVPGIIGVAYVVVEKLLAGTAAALDEEGAALGAALEAALGAALEAALPTVRLKQHKRGTVLLTRCWKREQVLRSLRQRPWRRRGQGPEWRPVPGVLRLELAAMTRGWQ